MLTAIRSRIREFEVITAPRLRCEAPDCDHTARYRLVFASRVSLHLCREHTLEPLVAPRAL
jgi:hypothetical protein